MKGLALVLSGYLVLAVLSCGTVYTPLPMGDHPVRLECEDWEGTWLASDGCAIVKVIDSEKGLLRIGWVDDSEGGLRFETLDVELRSSGKSLFANVRDEEEPLYKWVKLAKDGEQIVVWDPNAERFGTLVKEGKLPGRIEGRDVFLDALGPEHIQIIYRNSDRVLFDLENPSATIRIAKKGR